MKTACSLATLALVILLAPEVGALYIKPDLEKVPVERIITNLEAAAEKQPKNAGLRFNLARVHGMAYAKKADELEVFKGKLEQGPWFGFEPAFVPFAKLVVKTEDEKKLKQAKQHLEKAIASYQETLKLQPDNLAAQLGLAWTTEQTGDKKNAVAAYRKAIEAGWAKEKDKKFGPLGGHFITQEAAGYLIPLLDKDGDKAEIATLEERIAQLKKLPRPVTPLAIPLEEGLTLEDLLDTQARVAFDADGTGKKRWTWITPRAGWLVMDAKGAGRIESGLQLFGNVTFWLFWDDGYQALAALDDNGDGELTGAELAGLAIWQDRNGDGVSQPGEVRPLAEHGIVALSCRGEPRSGNPDCVVYSPRGVRFTDGTTRASYDVILRSR